MRIFIKESSGRVRRGNSGFACAIIGLYRLMGKPSETKSKNDIIGHNSTKIRYKSQQAAFYSIEMETLRSWKAAQPVDKANLPENIDYAGVYLTCLFHHSISYFKFSTYSIHVYTMRVVLCWRNSQRFSEEAFVRLCSFP